MLSGRTMLSVLLFVAAVAAVPSSVFAGGRKNGGTCTGARGCDGSNNGPQGYAWNTTPCQVVPGPSVFHVTCIDSNGHDASFDVYPGVYLTPTFFPTIVCSGGAGDCVNVPGFLCCTWSGGASCANQTFMKNCYKDYACAHGTSDPGN